MTRFFVIAPDEETIVGLLSMDETDALLNVGAGETLLALSPATDNGAVFLQDQVTVDLTGETPVFIDVASGLPTTDTSLTDLDMEEVTP